MKNARIFLLAILVTATLTLFGCGGGSSSSDSGGDTGGGTVVTSSTQTVSGSVDSPSSVSASQVGTASVFDNISVEIISYDNDDNIIDRKIAKTNSGQFATGITLLSTGGKIEIKIEKEGFVPFNRIVTYTDPHDIDVKALLNQVTTKIIPVDNSTISISSNGKKYISFAIFKDKNGNRQILSASEAKIKIAGGDTPEYGMEIPFDKVKHNLTGIKADIENFDPNKPEDMNNFPTSESDEGELITAGFDFTKLTDVNDGSNIFDDTKTSAAADDDVVAYATKYVGCGNLLGDMTDNDNEYRVNVYVLKNGKWKKIGSAYIQESWDNESPKDPSNVCNNTTNEYARIEVTDPDFAWVNLDYPLSWLKGEATELCVNVNFKDQDNNSITKFISYDYVDDDNNKSFSGGYGYTDNGSATISVLTDDTSDKTLKVSFYNPFSYEYETVDNISLSADPNNCADYSINLTNNLQCKIQGAITDNASGKSVSYQYIYAYDNETYIYFGYGYTDDNGNYSIDVPCDRGIKLYYDSNGYQVKQAKVDQIKNFDEKGDSNYEATVDFQKENNQPYGYGYFSTYRPTVNSSYSVYFYAYDSEGDYPISYILKKDGVQVDSGTFTGNEWNYKSYTTTELNAGNYEYTLDLTDFVGKSSTITLGTVEVLPEGNKPPVIAALFTSPTSTKFGNNLFFYYSIYDPDNDNMTISWVVKSGSCNVDNTSQTEYYVTSDKPGVCDVTMILSDNNSNTDNETITVTFTPNNPPVIIPYPYQSSIRVGGSINLGAYVYDLDEDSIAYGWTDNCSGGDVESNNSTASISSNEIESCTVTLTANDPSDNSTYTYDVSFTDNNPPTVIINVDNPAPKPGETIILTCNADDPDGDGIEKYTWINSYDNTTANTYNFSYKIDSAIPDGTVITFTCSATDDFALSQKTGENSVDITVTTVPTYGDITITSNE